MRARTAMLQAVALMIPTAVSGRQVAFGSDRASDGMMSVRPLGSAEGAP